MTLLLPPFLTPLCLQVAALTLFTQAEQLQPTLPAARRCFWALGLSAQETKAQLCRAH